MDRFAPILPRQLDIGPAAQPALAPVANPASAAAEPSDPATAQYRAKATEAAVKFESFFIGDMLHRMRTSTEALKDDDRKDSINRDMLDMADNLVADQMAGQRAFGVADAILRQLLPSAAPVAPHLPGSPMPLAPATKSGSNI
jgi:peptidoglycan hydrolase FlgJ